MISIKHFQSFVYEPQNFPSLSDHSKLNSLLKHTKYVYFETTPPTSRFNKGMRPELHKKLLSQREIKFYN